MRIRYKLIGVAAPAGTGGPIEPVAQQQEAMSTIDIPSGSTVRDLARRIGVTVDHALVNGADASPGDGLSDGDEVGLFGPSAGKM